MEKIAEIIKYEGDNSVCVWKHPKEDFNSMTQLIVHESQEALFFMNGQALDLFGAGRYTLETQNIPKIGKLLQRTTGDQTPFHCEVYFINKTVQPTLKWGTPDKVRFIDPLTGVPLELGASGEMFLQVEDSRRLLIKLVGTTGGIAWERQGGFTTSLRDTFRPLIVNAVRTNLPGIIKENSIDILEIDEHIDEISQNLVEKIRPDFAEYGLTIPAFFVGSVVLPENDPNFKRIKELHTITLQTRVIQAEAVVRTAQAQSEATYRTAQEQSKAAIEAARRQAELERQTTETEVKRREAERTIIQAQAEAEAQRLAGMTEAEIMRAKGYNEKDVLQAEVQKAYAEGLGQMGANGGGGTIGDIAGLGVALGAMGGMMGMTKEAISPLINPQPQLQSQQETPQPVREVWSCSCGKTGIASNFCPDCGKPKPTEPEKWNCICGQKDITSKFCPDCGRSKEDQQ